MSNDCKGEDWTWCEVWLMDKVNLAYVLGNGTPSGGEEIASTGRWQ